MRHLAMLLLPVTLLVSPVRADDPPPNPLQKPAEEPLSQEFLSKIRLTLDPAGHTNDIRKVLFTPDGKQLLSGSTDGTVRIWNTHSGETIRVLRFPGHANCVPALSPDGQLLAVNGQYSENKAQVYVIYLVSMADGHIERVLKGHTGGIRGFAFSPDGKRLASASVDKTIRLWKIASDEPAEVIQAAEPVQGLAFSPTGNRLVESTLNGFAIRDLKTGKLLPLKGGTIRKIGSDQDNVAWSRDGKTVATCSEDGLRLWEPDGKLRLHLLQNICVQAANFSPDSSRIVACLFADKRATVFDVRTGKTEAEFAPKDHYSFFWDGAFSPDGKTIAVGTAGETKVIYLWNAATGRLVKHMGAPSWIINSDLHAGWSADGKTVAWRIVDKPESWKGGPTSFQPGELRFGPLLNSRQFHGSSAQAKGLSLKIIKPNTVQVLTNGKPATELIVPAPYDVRDPLVVVNAERAAICPNVYGFFLFDTTTGKLIRRLYHPGWVLSLAPSPDGRFVMSLSEDQTLRIWDAEKGKSLLSLYVSGRDWIIWTDQGYYAATPGGERLMGWHVDNGPDQLASFYPAERFRKQLYRPDVIKLVLEKGSVAAALKEANEALKKEGVQVAEGTAKLDELLPPTVALSVVDKSKLPSVKFKVTAKAGAKEQPIQSLRLFVDGRPFTDKNAMATFERGVPQDEREWTVELPPGKHQVAVLARSADASNVSKEIEIDCRPAAEKPVLHVLAIGVNDYADKDLNLTCAANDAQLIASSFQKACRGDLFSEVKAQTLLNGQATHAAILQAVQALRTDPKHKAKPGDLIVLYFAGHGAKEKDQFYLLPHEAKVDDLTHTALSGQELREALKEMPCQVLLIMDACHSGAFGAKGTLSTKNLKPATDEATRTFTDDDVGVAVMCAAMGNETAAERGSNGLFSKALAEALTATQDVPFNHTNHRQYIHHLQAYVFDKVSEESGQKQHPFLHLPWVVESFAVRNVAAK